ncbi:MAG: TspO/MBR family protein [Ardenticatenales bacterium]
MSTAPSMPATTRGAWPLLNVVALVACLAANGAAVALPLFGRNTAAISDSFDVTFKPAGYVFSIWSVIYIGLIAFAVYQALPAQRTSARLAAIDRPFALSCIANGLWLVLWHALWFSATIIVMLVLLGSLITIYVRLDAGRDGASRLERWCVDVPFSVYLGWITVATIANATIVVSWAGWRGGPFDGADWTILLMAVGGAIASRLAATRRDAAYGLVLAWAFWGIAVQQGGSGTIARWAQVAAVYAAGLAVLAIARSMRSGGPRPTSVTGAS